MTFNREMTNVCKGWAILLLLCHHLFLDNYSAILSVPMQIVGVGGKLCVAIFLFLSGFGLIRAQGGGAVHMVRLLRLLVNFWIVVIPFVALSCVFTDRTFSVVYPQGAFPRFLFDMLGLTNNYTGFNPTWWFMGVIVPLYIMFPILRWISQRSNVFLLVMAAMSLFLIGRVRYVEWGLPFVLGMVLGGNDCLDRYISRISLWDLPGLVSAIPAVLLIRFHTVQVALLEPLYALALVLSVCGLGAIASSYAKWLKKGFDFIGKHSMNIFFLHTFLYGYFFRNFFNYFYPWLGVAVLLAMSLGCSILIEYFKRIIRIDSLFGYLKEKLA